MIELPFEMRRKKEASKEEYEQFREYLEILSEKSRVLRNHFYNYAFNDAMILKVADLRKTVEELYRLVEPYNS